MTKKILLIVSLFAVILCSTSFVFATNLVNGVQNATNAAGNVVNNTGAAITNAVNNTGNAIRTTTNNAGNTMNSAVTNTNRTATTTTNNAGYTATRTAAGTTTILGMSLPMWTWAVLGIAGLMIIGFVWYYGMQYRDNRITDDE